MTLLTRAPADAAASAVRPPTAAELAARIQVPRQLPVRYLSLVSAVNALGLLRFDVADMSSTLAS
jgi:hypothetical protein